MVGSIEKGKIDGYYISGAQPYSKFKKAIEMALRDADKK